jgi:hypothetical protein
MTSAETLGDIAISDSLITVTLLDLQCTWTKQYLDMVDALSDLVKLKIVNGSQRLEHTVYDTDVNKTHLSFKPNRVRLRFLVAAGFLCTALQLVN